MKEVWLKVMSCIGLEASSLGRLRSAPNCRFLAGKVRKLTPDRAGYMTVTVRHVNSAGKYRTMQAGALVCEAFNGPGKPGEVCCRRDKDPSNDLPSNLFWGPRGVRPGRVPRGSVKSRRSIKPGTPLGPRELPATYRRAGANTA